MFNLESAIASWRKQMLAADALGQSHLNELESHLREDIDALVQSGLSKQDAFGRAIVNIGEAKPLAAEFIKSTPYIRMRHVMIRVFALLWAAGSLASLNAVYHHVAATKFNGARYTIDAIVASIYVSGIVGCILLFLGSRAGVWILRGNALLFFVACIPQIFLFNFSTGWRDWCAFVAVFCVATIALLRGQERGRLKAG